LYDTAALLRCCCSKGARYGSANRAPSFTQKLTVGCKEGETAAAFEKYN
jgi:hypothetical protein